MNRTLLFMSALALCGSSMLAQAYNLIPLPYKAEVSAATVVPLADEAGLSMEYRLYQGTDIQGLQASGLSSGEVKLAVCMPAADAASFAGNKITSLNIVTPPNAVDGRNANYVRDVTIFLSESRDGEPFYTQDAYLGLIAKTNVNVKLDTPYEIPADKELWFGYSFTLNRNIAVNQYYIANDGVPAANDNGSWAQLGGRWQSIAKYGSLLIGAEISGDNLPVDKASLIAIEGNSWAEQNRAYTFSVGVKNDGANELENAEIEYSLNDGTILTKTGTFETPVTTNGVGYISASLNCTEAGGQYPLSVKLTKVNGVEVSNGSVITKTIVCYSTGSVFMRKVLVEEGTGTWCGWCPGGMILLEQIKEKYNDGSAILVGVHSGDKMVTNSYSSFIDWAYSGFPQYTVNRQYTGGVTTSAEANFQRFQAMYDEVRATPAKAKIDLFLEWTSDDRNSVHAETQTIFAKAGTGTYKVAFIVVEDGIGPYAQQNNYSGTPGFGKFSTGGSVVSTMYDDVARDIFSAFGLDGSAIVDPEAMNYYNYSYEVSLAKVSDISKTRIVAALLDSSTREVVNVVEVPLSNCSGVGDVEVADEQVSIRGEMGAVVVNGAAVTEVYTVAGARVATAYGEASINLPAGLYIVKADKVVKKVVVK